MRAGCATRAASPTRTCTRATASPTRCVRVRRRGYEELSWDDALDRAAEMLRRAEGKIVTALSGSETVELAYGLGKLMRDGPRRARRRCCRRRRATPSTPSGCHCRRSATREIVVVLGDEPVSDRAPIVDMWIKLARRNGAEIVTVGPAGDVQAAPGARGGRCCGAATELSGPRSAASDRAILIWSGGGGHGGVTLAALARELGLAGKEGSGAFHLPSAPNARGVADAWACAADETSPNPQPIKLLIVSGDEAAADPNVRTLAEHAEQVLAIAMFGQLVRGWADLVLPGNELPRARRDVREPRGTTPASPPRGHPAGAGRARLAGEARRALRRRALAVSDRGLRRGLGAGLRRDLLRRGRRAGAASAARAGRATKPPSPPPPRRRRREEGRFASSATARSSPARRWSACGELQFQRPEPELELAAADASSRGIANGDLVRVSSNGTSVELRARVSKKLRAGVARAAEEHTAELQAGVEVSRA